MKVLFIGGTGNISGAVSRLCIAQGIELWHLNRGQRPIDIPGVKSLVADINDPVAVKSALGNQTFDVVVNFIAFTAADIARDEALFAGRCGQYIFIGTASSYQKPLAHPIVTESTPLKNPYWDYSHKKIEAEEALNRAYRERDFPMVIVRPSLTYDTVIPVAVGGWGCFTWVDRVRRGLPVICHGDGTNLWTVTHSEDFGRGLIGLFGNPQTLGHAFHITSDELLTWEQIYRQIGAAAGAEPKLVFIPSDFIGKVIPWKDGCLRGDKAHSAIFDNTKIKTFVPGFRAEIPFRVGIARTIRWFEADPRRLRIDPDVNARHEQILSAWGKR